MWRHKNSASHWFPSCFSATPSKSCIGHSTLPLRSGSSLFSRTSLASVPSSMRSSLVMTPMVLRPAPQTNHTLHNLQRPTSFRDIYVSMLIAKHSFSGSFPVPPHLILFSNPQLPHLVNVNRMRQRAAKPPIHKITLDPREKKTNSCFTKILLNV